MGVAVKISAQRRARRAFLCAAISLIIAPALAAHSASPLKTAQEIVVAAPPEKVWALVADFQHWDWLPDVATIEGSGGATPDKDWRRLTLVNGLVVEQSLIRLDPDRKMIGWHIDQADVSWLPAVNYTGFVTVRAGENGQSIVEWKARYYRGFPYADPPANLNDDAAEAAVTALHAAALAALKARAEAK